MDANPYDASVVDRVASIYVGPYAYFRDDAIY